MKGRGMESEGDGRGAKGGESCPQLGSRDPPVYAEPCVSYGRDVCPCPFVRHTLALSRKDAN